ncbi:uncharacterized protein A1O5_04351 [Cladophialophora psammophila CBS 110553]|uniref:Uncharacterized protein n=1 Tax=Cladophialophora psammophila CBS 110553 TaxID=1182543 RepID=W9X3J8_9EURO|nr:uncharacterized protein A1O5_04351 [Cladophialophora psammophila CBS 110553]EXJ71850.1 hypothetical protein A1O5_04351 [Cladophialophora psammophila CBS 110553]
METLREALEQDLGVATTSGKEPTSLDMISEMPELPASTKYVPGWPQQPQSGQTGGLDTTGVYGSIDATAGFNEFGSGSAGDLGFSTINGTSDSISMDWNAIFDNLEWIFYHQSSYELLSRPEMNRPEHR